MICKLKLRFDKIYADYRCFLWTVMIIQALSLLILVTTSIVLISNWNDFVMETLESNEVLFSILLVIYEIVA